MEKEELSKEKLQDAQERIQEAISVIVVLETDLSVEGSDGVYSGVIKVVHRILSEAKHTVDELIHCIEECTQ